MRNLTSRRSTRRQEGEEQPEAVGHDVGHIQHAMRHRIAAIEPPPQPEPRAFAADLDAGIDRPRPLHRVHHHQLRQVDTEIAVEPPRPRAAGQHHLVAGDPALFGHHARHPAAGEIEAAHRALREDRRTRPLRRRRQAGAALLGSARPSEAGRSPFQRSVAPGITRAALVRAQHLGVELIGPRMVVRPPAVVGKTLLGLGQIDDARLTESCLGAHPLIHPPP